MICPGIAVDVLQRFPAICLYMKKILLILTLTGSLYAQPDPCPACELRATRDTRISLGHGASIEVHQGQTFTGRICLNLVRIEINGIQYEASRNDFSLVRYLPHK
jgi:hypothetical protein